MYWLKYFATLKLRFCLLKMIRWKLISWPLSGLTWNLEPRAVVCIFSVDSFYQKVQHRQDWSRSIVRSASSSGTTRSQYGGLLYNIRQRWVSWRHAKYLQIDNKTLTLTLTLTVFLAPIILYLSLSSSFRDGALNLTEFEGLCKALFRNEHGKPYK